MKQFQDIQREVGAWSRANFGDQESPHFIIKMEPFPDGWKVNDPMPPTLVALGSLAPLMGLVEELGEMFDASHKGDTIDAIGDVFIYLCDYCSREEFKLPIGRDLLFQLEAMDRDDLAALVVYTGRLFHAVLKRHQGIRGFDDDDKFNNERNMCVAMILAHLDHFVRQVDLGTNLLMVANQTWNGVMAKRNWKKDPSQGGSHDHTDVKA